MDDEQLVELASYRIVAPLGPWQRSTYLQGGTHTINGQINGQIKIYFHSI